MNATMANPDLRRKLKVRVRPDLEIKPQRYGGQRYFIVKDSVALRYYRFREEELFLLKQFNGKRTLDDVRHQFVENFRPQRLSVVELEKFVQQLLYTGLASVDTPQLGQRLYDRYKEKRKEKIKQFFLNLLFIKVPLFDPERLLAALLPCTRFLFTLPFFFLALTFGVASLLLVLVNWHTFVGKLPNYHEFFTVRNVMFFWVTLAVVKVMHEFGHGLSCKRFGGEVHEMGLLFLVLTPCMYCNVTDSWMLPNKWHRVIIGAAGIYVELILSSIFVWIWWYSDPGLLNTLALSIIFICSVSTVVFNGNPLLRYDGYYILADLIEIPNLRERSNKYLGNLASRIFFGSEAVPDPYMPKKRKWFFALYAVLAYIYRWVVAIGILWFLYSFLKPYRLATIGALLAAGSAFSLLVFPAYRVAKTLNNRWRSMKVNKLRMTASLATAAAIVAALLLVPFPMHIDAPMILRPQGATTVFVQVPGILDRLFVADGNEAKPGMALAVLKDPELDKKLARIKLQQQQAEKARQIYVAMEQGGLANKAAIEAEYSSRIIESLKQQQQKLTITVPEEAEGTVFLPPKPQEMGKTYSAGQQFCQVGDPAKVEAYVVLQHSDTSLLQRDQTGRIRGQRVWVKLNGHVGAIVDGTITDVSSTEIEDLPQLLSNKMGGEVPTTTDQDHKSERPQLRSYAVQVQLNESGAALLPGVRGYARIDIGYRSLFWRIKRYLQQTFHFRM